MNDRTKKKNSHEVDHDRQQKPVISEKSVKNVKDANKKKPVNVEKLGKKEKHTDYEDFEKLEDFNDFVKATGWKAKRNNNQGRNNKAERTDRPIQTGRLEQNSRSEKSDRTVQNSRRRQSDRLEQSSRQDQTSRPEQNRRSEQTDRQRRDGRQGQTVRPEQNSRQGQNNRLERNSYKLDVNTNYKVKDTFENGRDRKGNHSPNKLELLNQYPRLGDTQKQVYQSKNSSSSLHTDTCPHMRECGGCNILRESYQVHLSEKQKEVEKLLKKYCRIEPMIGMEKPENYRNKVHVVFDHDRKGNPISGIYEERTHQVVPIEKCRIHNEKADAIIATIRGMLKSFKILTYDEDTGYGLLRHVLIRTGYHSGEILVVLVLASPILPSKNNFVKALLKEHPEITSVVVNVNDKKTSMVLGEKEQVIYGKGYIEDTLCGKTFRISPKSFYQVNPRQTEVLYRKAVELAKLTGEEIVVDAYCGIGTIGLIASEHAKKVIGVELNKDAVRDAVTNAKHNNTDNIEFYQNDAGVFLSQMAAAGDSVDVVIMDPPRTGSTNQFLDAIAAIRPKKVVYISCNPVTLERDLEYLTKKGYKAEVAVPVDMFPWTRHVETCVLLSHKNS